MSRLPLKDEAASDRFPGMDAMAQAGHWDRTTEAVVAGRLGMPPDIRFFSQHEEATAGALFDQLLDQHAEPRVPVVNMVDSRLAEKETDGWHYEDMPTDGDAWRQSLAALDDEAQQRCGQDFADAPQEQQAKILQGVHDLGYEQWGGAPAQHVWSLWTRYACTAFYSHPWAWDEIGWAGPAYPRGYKNLGVDKLEPFEVPDAHPVDPTRLGTKTQTSAGAGQGASQQQSPQQDQHREGSA